MKKNMKKAFGGGIVNNLPEVINMDTLSYFDEESLTQLHERLQGEREKALSDGSDSTPWEVEICYVQRELKLRSTRRAIHEKYVRSNPDHNYYFDDDSGNADVYDRQIN